jgi:sarcosine/dimethylglycine N-methyltransferase
MTVTLEEVRKHYQAGVMDPVELLKRLHSMIDQIGKDSFTATDLASLDQFHIGGLPATIELANRAGVRTDMRVLDAGSGLGGPARYLAETFHCEVVGIDLAPHYVAIANALAHRAGLAGKVSFQVGNLATLPFAHGTFDLVWTQHVAMNISDRSGLYRELRRVLKPRGKLALYDVLAADEKLPPHYPLPWAQTPETSFLLTEDETIASIESAGFELLRWNNVTEQAMAWMANQQPSAASAGLSLVVGSRLGEMVANFRHNLIEGRIRLVMSIAEAL